MPTVPPALERIILKCMKKKPGQRYASAEKLLRAIGRLLKKKARRENLRQKLLLLRRPLRFRPLVYLVRCLELIILLFALGTLLGVILDTYFGSRLHGLALEYPLYFRTRFPMDKDHLPADWPAWPGDAWRRYRQVQQAQDGPHAAAARRLNREMKNLYRTTVTPANLDAVKKAVEQAGATFRLDKMIFGITSPVLAPKPAESLSPEFVATFSRWQALKARLGFLEGNTSAGVERLRGLGYFLLDAEAGAGSMSDYAQAVAGFRFFCQELVPLALAQDIDPATKQLEKIEPLLLLFLKKMNTRRLFRMAYLDDLHVVRSEDFNETWWTGPDYFWFGRFRFMSEMSTRNMQLYRTLVAERRAGDELSSISRQEDTDRILARFRHDDGKDWPQVGSSAFTSLQKSLGAERTMVKLTLLLERLQRFGIDDNQVVALLVSDLGMNDLSGEPWKIVQRDGTNIVHVTDRSEFAVRPITYATDHSVVIAEWVKITAAIGATVNHR